MKTIREVAPGRSYPTRGLAFKQAVRESGRVTAPVALFATDCEHTRHHAAQKGAPRDGTPLRRGCKLNAAEIPWVLSPYSEGHSTASIWAAHVFAGPSLPSGVRPGALATSRIDHGTMGPSRPSQDGTAAAHLCLGAIVGFLAVGVASRRTGVRCNAAVGDAAPDFNLIDENSSPMSLDKYAGKKVLIWWYPKADTGG
ncbi:unnamed protein product [Polarella glacialis]|uniref:Alkyl hydroperoxide reductase subunit C/ Thiol specific antioxidant domain-containing protein n=1 Tax=Polarella glacialis TaxID=89957 RepID=A0A813INV2_POLGL|nr:unnamed protein product [Polarella glacialis]